MNVRFRAIPPVLYGVDWLEGNISDFHGAAKTSRLGFEPLTDIAECRKDSTFSDHAIKNSRHPSS